MQFSENAFKKVTRKFLKKFSKFRVIFVKI